MPFELFIAVRYLRAKRRRRAVSVITAVASLGIGLGVAALLLALALVKGFRGEVQEKILQGTAHLNLLKADGGQIENYQALAAVLRDMPGISAAAATSYEPVLLNLSDRSEQAILKGVDLDAPTNANEVFALTIEGDPHQLSVRPADPTQPEAIIIGKELARTLGLQLDSLVTAVSVATRLTPAGLLPRPRYTTFRVTGIFSSGLYEYDSKWAYVALPALQRLSGQGQTAGVMQLRVSDLDQVGAIGASIRARLGAEYVTNSWQELNRPLFTALQLQQRVVVIFFILLIGIAALNIVTTLTLMVVEKQRDIAILRAQGATPAAIRRIFCWQGLLIGSVSTTGGLGLGLFLHWLLNTYRLISVPAEIYSISHLTLRLRLIDCLGVCLVSLMICLLSTLYPAYTAGRLHPIEALRYQ
jgi:lipoprotein-releasing system permease protein